MEAKLPMNSPRGAFLITIDVEGDNAWSRTREVSTRNAGFLPRFQELCDKFDFIPTYLTNYEMAGDPFFAEFARDAANSERAEIGMHLHAWNSPPHVPLTADDFLHCPYLIEFPDDVIRRKVEFMTRFLEDTFSRPIESHRAGRWALNPFYVRVLSEFGYRSDCSVTPRVDWSASRGAPGGRGGTDYRRFPRRHYWIGGADISRSAISDLLEVPMTVFDPCPPSLASLARSSPLGSGLSQRALRRIWPLEWLRPDGHNLRSMLRILTIAERENWPYVEFMLHSSELMPGGSPTFSDEGAIEHLYDHITALFEHAASRFVGRSLAMFRECVTAARRPGDETCYAATSNFSHRSTDIGPV